MKSPPLNEHGANEPLSGATGKRGTTYGRHKAKKGHAPAKGKGGATAALQQQPTPASRARRRPSIFFPLRPAAPLHLRGASLPPFRNGEASGSVGRATSAGCARARSAASRARSAEGKRADASHATDSSEPTPLPPAASAPRRVVPPTTPTSVTPFCEVALVRRR